MNRLRVYFRRWSASPKVRPWALLAPVLLILIAAPQLRPLRFPAHPGNDEKIRLETVEAIVETGTFSIDRDREKRERWLEGTVTLHRPDDAVYSGQPPLMASLLSGAYWIMNRSGLSMEENPTLVGFLLTLLGSTLPAAVATGLTYRMARMFELQRTWRSLLSVAVGLGSGIGSYGVVLNPHVPAATLVLGAAAAIIHWARSPNPFRAMGWLGVAGLCAGFAGTIDPLTVVFLFLFLAPVFALRVGFPTRLAGALLYIAGASFPLLAHTSICLRIGIPVIPEPFVDAPEDLRHASFGDDDSESINAAQIVFLRGIETTLGNHGTLVHFPVLLIGCFGIAAVMHRHWPLWMKSLAAATAIGGVVIFCIVVFSKANLQYSMYANRWFISFSPLLMLWCGSWLKRPHPRGVRISALICLIFSVVAGIIGMLHPWPIGGYQGFTLVDVFSRLTE